MKYEWKKYIVMIRVQSSSIRDISFSFTTPRFEHYLM